jgi:glutaredoxin
MSARTWLFLVAVLGGLLQNRDAVRQWFHPRPPIQQGSEKVVLYSTTWCGYCAKTREFFRSNNIVYEERDVETSETGRSGYQNLGGGGVPIVVVNDADVIRGYDPDAIEGALRR